MSTQPTSESPRPGNGASAGPATSDSVPQKPRPRSFDLDELHGMTVRELTDLYRAGTVPATLAALDGTPICRMLAVRNLDRGPLARVLRLFSSSRSFPWAGKSFESMDAGSGRGINRVRLGSERRWFPFETRVEASAIDGRPCILLDYDIADNPRPIRMIRDELREVSPGLFLGPAMYDDKKRPPTLVLYFACDHAH